MKKIFIAIMAVAALAVTSCKNSDSANNNYMMIDDAKYELNRVYANESSEDTMQYMFTSFDLKKVATQFVSTGTFPSGTQCAIMEVVGNDEVISTLGIVNFRTPDKEELAQLLMGDPSIEEVIEALVEKGVEVDEEALEDVKFACDGNKIEVAMDSVAAVDMDGNEALFSLFYNGKCTDMETAYK